MANVRFIRTTKIKHLNRETYDPNALYFCEDTQEIYKGQHPYTEGIKVIPTKADLPSCPNAADGVVYFITETKSGYMMSLDRTEWLQTIYAPVTDAYTIPESEMYTTVTTVGAVRDIEAKIYQRIEEVVSGGGLSGLTPVDGTITIVDNADKGKSIGVAISPIEGNVLTAVEGGLFVPTYKPVDGALIIKDNTIDIGISAEPGNALVKKEDGLYVGTSTSGNYAAGLGLQLVDGTFSIKLAEEARGLVAVDGALSLSLATKDSDGAMSKEDKAFLDALKDLNISTEYATKEEVQSLRESVERAEQAYIWEEM
jgi:hypothetical protein